MNAEKRKHSQKQQTVLIRIFFCVLIMTVILAGYTLARYSGSLDGSRQEAIPKGFYFYSDYLKEDDPMKQEVFNWNKNESFSFVLDVRNYEDEERVAEVPIQYQVELSDANCSYTVNDGAKTANSDQAYDMTEKAKSKDKITVTIPANTALESDTLTVKVKAIQKGNKGYVKDISGAFHMNAKNANIEANVNQKDDYVDLKIGVPAQTTIDITWPDTLVPDNTNKVMNDAAGSSKSIQIEADNSVLLRFFIKGDVSSTTKFTLHAQAGSYDQTLTIDLAGNITAQGS